MKEKYSRRGAFQRALGRWGELLTADHVFPTNEGCVGCGGLRYGFVIRDVWSRFLQTLPVPNKTTDEVDFAIRKFAGARLREVVTLYADQANEIRRARRRSRIHFEDNRAGVHHTNAIAERGNQLVEGGTTSCLIEAGQPTAYWPFATKVFCHHHNIKDFGEGTAWGKAFGEEFAGKKIPFGAAVLFKPSATRRMRGKFRPKGIMGVFAGYKFFPGGRWSKR